jgi:hypothetical protein
LGTGAEGFTVAAGLTFFSDSESLLSSELESSFLVGGLKIGGVITVFIFFSANISCTYRQGLS